MDLLASHVVSHFCHLQSHLADSAAWCSPVTALGSRSAHVLPGCHLSLLPFLGFLECD